MKKQKIAVLVSGGGTNLQALMDSQKAGRLNPFTFAKPGEIRTVITDGHLGGETEELFRSAGTEVL